MTSGSEVLSETQAPSSQTSPAAHGVSAPQVAEPASAALVAVDSSSPHADASAHMESTERSKKSLLMESRISMSLRQMRSTVSYSAMGNARRGKVR